jgi:hypothetical protein
MNCFNKRDVEKKWKGDGVGFTADLEAKQGGK